jgi:hypothetical protein
LSVWFAVYNCIYDYLGDGLDDFEEAMRKVRLAFDHSSN